MGKILKLALLIKYRNLHLKPKKIVLATGVFDLLHVEHLRFLKQAKKQGDILIVGLESDARVRQIKGRDRPLNSQNQRAEVLASLEVVDYVFILPENLGSVRGREELIANLKPAIYAVSQNTPFLKEKQRITKKFGALLKIVHRHNPEISTTKISASKIT